MTPPTRILFGLAALLVSGTAQASLIVYSSVGSGSWTAPTGVTSIKLLVVAGGGTGGAQAGGGAGGVLYNSAFAVTPGTSYSYSIGAGGNISVGNQNGSSSSFDSLVAVGGGRGTWHDNTPTGLSGGSGGGGGWDQYNVHGKTSPNGDPGAGTAGQGYAGGYGYAPTWANFNGGGGGGAGSKGGDATAAAAGNGGIGRDFSAIFGSTSFGVLGWVGGGGAGACGTGINGIGGGSGGGDVGVSGLAGTGGGGGASGIGGAGGTNGGSGLIVFSYEMSAVPEPSSMLGLGCLVGAGALLRTRRRND